MLEDADLEEAATLAATGSYKNSGQRCTAVKRMLVQERWPTASSSCWWRRPAPSMYGDPFDPAIDMGTVIDEPLGAAIRRGGERGGGRRRPAADRQCAPRRAVLPDRARPGDAGHGRGATETFGPVSPVIRFKTVEEAIRIANGTAYGLSSSLCTNRMDLITRFIQELNVGSVNVREVPGTAWRSRRSAGSRIPAWATRRAYRKP